MLPTLYITRPLNLVKQNRNQTNQQITRMFTHNYSMASQTYASFELRLRRKGSVSALECERLENEKWVIIVGHFWTSELQVMVTHYIVQCNSRSILECNSVVMISKIVSQWEWTRQILYFSSLRLIPRSMIHDMEMLYRQQLWTKANQVELQCGTKVIHKTTHFWKRIIQIQLSDRECNSIRSSLA